MLQDQDSSLPVQDGTAMDKLLAGKPSNLYRELDQPLEDGCR